MAIAENRRDIRHAFVLVSDVVLAKFIAGRDVHISGEYTG